MYLVTFAILSAVRLGWQSQLCGIPVATFEMNKSTGILEPSGNVKARLMAVSNAVFVFEQQNLSSERHRLPSPGVRLKKALNRKC